MELSMQEPQGDASAVVVYKEKQFQTAKDIIEYLKDVENTNDRYTAQTEVLERMTAYHDRAGDIIEEVFNYVMKDEAYTGVLSRDEFMGAWKEVVVIVEANGKRRNRLDGAKRTVGERWSEGTTEWLHQQQASGMFMRAVGMLSKKYSEKEAAQRTNRAVVDRLSTPRKGISAKKIIQSCDIMNATKMKECKAVTEGELRLYGLRIGDFGFAEEGTPREALEGSEPDHGSVAHFPARGWEMGAETGNSSMGSPVTEPAEEEGEDFCRMIEDERIDGELMEEVDRELDEQSRVGDEDGPELEDRPVKRRKTKESACGCSRDVTKGWKTAVTSKRAFEMGLNLKLLKAMVEFRHTCYAHAKAMGGHMGLMVKSLKAEQLQERLQYIHENRLDIGRLKTSKETFLWFRMKNRPPRASDALGPYKFMHTEVPSEFDYDQEQLLASIDGKAMQVWKEEGSVNVDIFAWWFNTEIGELLLQEFDMYRHHLREINGKSNYGWLRDMFYSVAQQLMRQDPVYYALYAALRPDKQWRLVSYPYYAKYAVQGDNTYFRHIDLNVPELIANDRGQNMIQGSVSLDDEDKTNCTVILPGMQHKLKEWWPRVVARGQGTDGFVHRISDQVFSKKDAEDLGIDWKRVPCRRGEVRVTLPQLPHGADGPSTGVRRTMLPWFVGLQDDLETLEVVEGGTWDMLSRSHRDMTAPEATPSGLANRYGAIPYRFPASVELSGLGALSDALVCRRRWDSALVIRDRDIMLGRDREAAREYVDKWRERAVEAVVEGFREVKEEEKRRFGEKSYFYHLDRMERLGIPMPVVEADEEEWVAESRDAVEEDFAEAGEGRGES
jgi:hypothetical protein